MPGTPPFTRRDALCLGAGLALSGATGDLRASPSRAGTLIVSHPSGLAHEVGAGRFDQPERLRAIAAILERDEFATLQRASAPITTRRGGWVMAMAAVMRRAQAWASRPWFWRASWRAR